MRVLLGLTLVGVLGCPQLLDDDFGAVTPTIVLGDGSGGAGPRDDAGLPKDLPPPDAGGLGAGAGGTLSAAGAAGSGSGGCAESVELCDGLDNNCDEQVDEGAACSVDCEGVVIQGRSYMYCGGPGAAPALAATRCSAERMGLASVESAQENAAILGAIAPLHAALSSVVEEQASIWLSAQDLELEGTWRWGAAGAIFWQGAAAGSAQSGAYTNWSAGKPNNNDLPDGEDCGALYLAAGSDGGLGEWNDITCTESHAFLCEETAP